MIQNRIYGSANISASYPNSSMPYIPVDYTPAYNGALKWNSSKNSFEVFDGHMWIQISSDVTHIDLSFEVREILDWARKKMEEEKNLEQLKEKYPSLKNAHDQYLLVKNLVAEHNEN